MAYKINGTTVVDNSRNVCACCVTSCCITATSRMDAPSGTTANRPASPATGSLYFDTDLGSLISYNGSDWAAVGGGGDFQYQWSFFFMGGHQDPYEAKCITCYYCVNDAPSAIYPHIDGGWDAITAVDSFHLITCYDAPYQVTYTTSRPSEGISGTIASFQGWNTEVWKCSNSSTKTFSSTVTMNSPIPFKGLCPTSSKILYSLTPGIGPGPQSHYNPYVCYSWMYCDADAGVLGFVDPNGGLSLKIRCYCICACDGYCCPNGYPAQAWVGAMNVMSNGVNCHCYSRIFAGDQACGFAFGSGVYSAPSCICSGNHVFWTIGGFNHDYFLKDDTTATEATSPMKATVYCTNCNFPYMYNGVFDLDCKRLVGLVQGKCAAGYAIFCLCNTACDNPACWEVCTSPYYADLSCCYGQEINTRCGGVMNPGEPTLWAGSYLWGVTQKNSSCNYPILWRASGGSVSGWTFNSGGNPACTHLGGFFIDCDCNMRLFGFSGDCTIKFKTLVEVVIPYCVGVAGSFHTATGANAMCVYKYCMRFECCIDNRYRMATGTDFQSNCSCPHYNIHPPSKFTQFLRYDCANNRVAINNFIKYGYTNYCAYGMGGASMLIPVFPTSCTGSKFFFSDNPYLCIERIPDTCCRVYAPTTCTSRYYFCSIGSAGGGTSYPASCLNMCKMYSTGIALCPGFRCFKTDFLMAPTPYGCSCICTGSSASMSGFANNCCYFLGS
jgi:hypothetical protein